MLAKHPDQAPEKYKEEDWECPFCKKKFAGPAQLTRHKTEVCGKNKERRSSFEERREENITTTDTDEEPEERKRKKTTKAKHGGKRAKKEIRNWTQLLSPVQV